MKRHITLLEYFQAQNLIIDYENQVAEEKKIALNKNIEIFLAKKRLKKKSKK